MTGPEKETLALVLAVLERMEAKMDEIDKRVQQMEITDARAVGVAAGSAAAAIVRERSAEQRSLTLRSWIAIGIALTAALTTLLVKFFEVFAR